MGIDEIAIEMHGPSAPPVRHRDVRRDLVFASSVAVGVLMVPAALLVAAPFPRRPCRTSTSER